MTMTATASRPLNVLLVDDNDDSCELFQLALEMNGHTVTALTNGTEGYRALVDGAFDVAVLDIGLPGMDGYEVAREARATLGERTPQLIALTGYGLSSDKEAASSAGFAAHLLKPVEVPELLATIARVLEPPQT